MHPEPPEICEHCHLNEWQCLCTHTAEETAKLIEIEIDFLSNNGIVIYNEKPEYETGLFSEELPL